MAFKVHAAPPPPRRNRRKWALGASVAAVLVLSLWQIPEVAHALRKPASEYHRITLQTPTVAVDHQLILTIETKRLRVCMWNWVQQWDRVTMQGDLPIASSEQDGAARIINVDLKFDMPLKLPSGITPGNYALHISGTASCDYGDNYMVEDQPLYFTVVHE